MSEPAKGHLYIIKSEEGPVKIGISINPHSRIDNIETGSGRQIIRQFISPALPGYAGLEKAMHQQFADKRMRGEWFMIDFDEAVKVAHLLGAIANPRPWTVSEDYIQGALHRKRLVEFTDKKHTEGEMQAFLNGMGARAREQVELAEALDFELLAESIGELQVAMQSASSLQEMLGIRFRTPPGVIDMLKDMRAQIDQDMAEFGLTPK